LDRYAPQVKIVGISGISGISMHKSIIASPVGQSIASVCRKRPAACGKESSRLLRRVSAFNKKLEGKTIL
jgi:hypothetical protein